VPRHESSFRTRFETACGLERASGESSCLGVRPQRARRIAPSADRQNPVAGDISQGGGTTVRIADDSQDEHQLDVRGAELSLVERLDLDVGRPPLAPREARREAVQDEGCSRRL